MKNLKKALVAAVLSVATILTVGSFVACGGAGATSTGVYLSNNNLTYSNMLPNYNYFSATTSAQTLETFSDNTYCLTITAITFSNISLGADVATGEETWNDRGQTVTKYYGTFTAVEDEGDLDITLSAPTRTTYSTYGTIVLDSAVTYADDQIYTDIASNEYSYNDYIKSIAERFTGANVYVNGAGATFKQIKIGR